MDMKTSPLATLNDPGLLKTDALIGGQWVAGNTRFDVTDPATVQRTVDAILAQHGGIDRPGDRARVLALRVLAIESTHIHQGHPFAHHACGVAARLAGEWPEAAARFRFVVLPLQYVFVANRGFVMSLCFGLLCFYEHYQWRRVNSRSCSPSGEAL